DVFAVKLAQAPAEIPKHPQRQFGIALQNFSKVFAGDKVNFGSLLSDRVGGTRCVVQYRHLTKEFARTEGREHPSLVVPETGADLNFPVNDEIKSVTCVAFLENALTRLKRPQLGKTLQGGQVALAHSSEHFRAAQPLHRGS